MCRVYGVGVVCACNIRVCIHVRCSNTRSIRYMITHESIIDMTYIRKKAKTFVVSNFMYENGRHGTVIPKSNEV